jgi:hypothetical protein
MRPTTLVGFLLSACLAAPGAWGQALKAPADFAGISDPAERSRALFAEAGKVIESPRCQNCHPVGERPTQGDDMQPHLPLVVRGQDGHGAIAMRCATCHQVANFQPAGVPGAPKWHIAPVEMAWQGKSLGAICEQIKDPARNGGKDMGALRKHLDTPLVTWGWSPGFGRAPVSTPYASFISAWETWAAAGAPCPN